MIVEEVGQGCYQLYAFLVAGSDPIDPNTAASDPPWRPVAGLGSTFAAVVMMSVQVGCTTDQGREPPELRSATLEPVRVLELEESDSAYIGEIFSHASVDFGPGGDLLIGDRMTSRVLRFTSDGAHVATAGREGEGPGEYESIRGAAWEAADRVWVISSTRVTILDSELGTLGTMAYPNDPRPTSVQFTEDQAIVALYDYVKDEDALGVFSRDGEGPLRTMLPYEPVAREPYVRGEYRPVFRVVGDTVLGGSTVTYPHRIMDLDGEVLAEFGSPPPSVGEMRVPERGEFAVDIRAGNLWQRSFGTTSSMWIVHDSLIVVEHRRPHPEPGGIPVATYRADLYDRWTLAMLVEDMELPGRIMDWHDGLLWLLTDSPPGPWTFTGFEVRVQ